MIPMEENINMHLKFLNKYNIKICSWINIDD